MADPVLLVEKQDGVATLTLNRPEQKNALSPELRWALKDSIESIRTDREVGVVILTGAGRAFRAGLDLKEMGIANRDSGGRQPLPRWSPSPERKFKNGHVANSRADSNRFCSAKTTLAERSSMRRSACSMASMAS
jgi:enoyl-CoA hydratase/carnithine racemase